MRGQWRRRVPRTARGRGQRRGHAQSLGCRDTQAFQLVPQHGQYRERWPARRRRWRSRSLRHGRDWWRWYVWRQLCQRHKRNARFVVARRDSAAFGKQCNVLEWGHRAEPRDAAPGSDERAMAIRRLCTSAGSVGRVSGCPDPTASRYARRRGAGSSCRSGARGRTGRRHRAPTLSTSAATARVFTRVPGSVAARSPHSRNNHREGVSRRPADDT